MASDPIKLMSNVPAVLRVALAVSLNINSQFPYSDPTTTLNLTGNANTSCLSFINENTVQHLQCIHNPL